MSITSLDISLDTCLVKSLLIRYLSSLRVLGFSDLRARFLFAD
jgi:hypothetical protein